MTQRDYIVIAGAIERVLFDADAIKATKEERDAIYSVAVEIAYRLKAENDNFDRLKFMNACGFNK